MAVVFGVRADVLWTHDHKAMSRVLQSLTGALCKGSGVYMKVMRWSCDGHVMVM